VRWQAWTAFRAAVSRQTGPPVQYQRQWQLSQLQQDIRSSWRWFLHGLPQNNRTLSKLVPERSLTLALDRLLARRPDGTLVNPAERGVPSERRHDQKSGNESSGQDFRSLRPSLAVNFTAHVADSQRFYCRARCSQKQALAQIAKSGGLGSVQNCSSARKREICRRGGRRCWCVLTRTRLRYAQPP
jgi:hypothetical protein